MRKANSSREDSKWSTLDTNILATIFDKLDIMDITMGASRVCIYWFLVSHNNNTTLWNTIDLTKLKHKGKNVFYKYRVDDEVEEALSFSNFLIKINKLFFNFYKVDGIKLRDLLIEITKLSRTSPRNLFFNFYSCLQKEDLMFVAERIPNIEKLALPVSWSLYNEVESFRFAFGQWKNLNTLIMVHNEFFLFCKFQFRVVGENCNNLNNLKIMGRLGKYDAVQIVRYLQSLKRLSLRCSVVYVEEVISLIRGLENLTTLNLTHCLYLGIDMERLDGARRIQRWTLSMKSVLSSIYRVMFMRSGKVPSWENMDSDILAKIFEKLNVVDITVGASRVCVTWFLAAHQKSLWKTINLANPQLVEFKHPRVKNLRLKSQYVNVEEGLHNIGKILIRVTKFSGTVPTNLFFNFNFFVEDEDLIIASERMPNIRKLVLPQWCNIRESSYKFAFSQWKNLLNQAQRILNQGQKINE
ncbi:PREDICTED: putative F-box protein At4g11580 [Camelina sativa]|uniref:F-box protein At4g11580 n=1 Tax=Camelina sativa TaxID=90675 RepID=A0ABM0TD40_CAMSA|nr:PREDICTED: putative F-box protein At4g11580 [Camelina sativa]